MNAEARKKALRHFFAKVVEPLGFKFTPDAELAEFLLDQEVTLETKHGVPFCPCRPIRRDEALLVRALRTQGRHRPRQPAAADAEGDGP